jgi:hypothetical protein
MGERKKRSAEDEVFAGSMPLERPSSHDDLAGMRRSIRLDLLSIRGGNGNMESLDLGSPRGALLSERSTTICIG